MENPFEKMANWQKILAIIVLVVVAYSAALYLIEIFSPQPVAMGIASGQLPRGQVPRMRDMMAIYSNSQENGNYALLAGVIVGIAALYFALQGKNGVKGAGGKEGVRFANRHPLKRKILLSRDERLIIDRLKEVGEITQDSLRSQMGWSKAKASTVLVGMERRELIKRAKFGKTHSVSLRKNSPFSV
ncbi:MAG: hypothetical protein ABH863_05150 [Candidatus Micrarchaeota archaeon]